MQLLWSDIEQVGLLDQSIEALQLISLNLLPCLVSKASGLFLDHLAFDFGVSFLLEVQGAFVVVQSAICLLVGNCLSLVSFSGTAESRNLRDKNWLVGGLRLRDIWVSGRRPALMFDWRPLVRNHAVVHDS